jgi:hypothetical protein
MMPSSLRRPLRRADRRAGTFRPRLEGLEDRTAPAVVNFVNSAGGDWSVPGNWSTGALPTANDDVVIDLTGISVTHNSGTDTIKSLSLSDPLSLAGGSLALGGPSFGSPAVSTLNQPLTVTGGALSLTYQALNASNTGRLIDAPGGSVTVKDSTVNAPLDNQGQLLVQGSLNSALNAPLANQGLLVVEGNHNTFAGAFSNAAGAILRVEGSGGFGLGAGLLTVSQGFTNAGAIELTTTFGPAGAGLNVFNGTLTNTGTLRVLAGNSDIINAQLDNQGTFTVGVFAQFFVQGASTNSGTLRVTGGLLRVAVSSSGPTLTNTGVMAVDSGATLEINNLLLANFSAGTLTGGTYRLAGTLQFALQYGNVQLTTNAANLVLDGPAAQVLNQSGGDALAGLATNAAAGSFTVQNGRNFLSTGTFTNAGALTVGGGSTFTQGGAFNQTGTSIIHSGGTLTLKDGNSTGVILDDGTLDVTANTAFTQSGLYDQVGALQVESGGTLKLAGPFGNFDPGNGTLSGGSYQVAGALRFAQAALTVDDATLSLSGPAAAVTDLPGNDALAGLSSIGAAGSLNLSGHNLTTAGDLRNGGVVTVDASSTLAVGGNYTQTGGLTFLSGGALAARGTVTLLGGLLAGYGAVDASVVNAALIQVGDDSTVGTLTIDGDYTQTADGALAIKVGGYNAGVDFDQLAVTGVAALDGTLAVTLVSGFSPNPGDTFPVVAAGSVSGSFATLAGDGSSFDQLNDGANLNLVSH